VVAASRPFDPFCPAVAVLPPNNLSWLKDIATVHTHEGIAEQ
jgi:hypothetical protein